MNGAVVLLIAVAVGLVGFGANVLSDQLHRFPIDIRRPGPLIRVRRNKPSRVHSPELRRLVTVISYAMIDDQTSKAELQTLFDDLDAPVSPLVPSDDKQRGQTKRSSQIDTAITALEQRYGL